jgi:hypothetical protein
VSWSPTEASKRALAHDFIEHSAKLLILQQQLDDPVCYLETAIETKGLLRRAYFPFPIRPAIAALATVLGCWREATGALRSVSA